MDDKHVLPHAISIGKKARGKEKEKRTGKRRERQVFVKDKYCNT
jgi:hypothetical protein